ncbi:N-acetylmuramoyl-L-alanine amidase [Sporobacter termitidis DSM 10068]|uniref:N-acetylmuramoyl-L-alanine amidase n=1 Tax=Sporobacter termitidis DSM 10068 TaxID=1123282 RepID=A0A1M5WGG6_9FIRM|nr:cell wall hydrolase [Sporobacter termitidis]SHH86601.1 N-acetylmuramoyl-L-alanine amidase [Sporobacter termitidis DSM 10068]
MKKWIASLTVLFCLLAGTLTSAGAISLRVDSAPASVRLSVQNETTYAPLRAMTALLAPGAAVSWENGQAVVRTQALTVTARPGDIYLNANGRMLYIADGVQVSNGSVLVPVRVLARAFGASVAWDGATGTASVASGSGTIAAGDSYYNSNDVYWLARIINAESSGEPLKGKLAVGNVILNRVKSADFPDTIYDVIFDDRWGGQFQPVNNGTIYDTPSADSVLAAKLCLDGASVAGGSLFFLNPAISSNLWTMENRTLVATIGSHQFYA